MARPRRPSPPFLRKMDAPFSPIGVIRSCFKEKFGIPRQPGLAPDARATLEIFPPFDAEEAFRGLSEFSHVWLIFVFHESARDGWKPTVRPPRLGGNRRIGVFATRSGFRPNPIGLSAVELTAVERLSGTLTLSLAGVDLLDGTPVLDIKPYLPYADAIPGATGGFAPEAPKARAPVEFSQQATTYCERREADDLPYLRKLITQILALDPRPAYRSRKDGGKRFGVRIFDVDVKWEYRGSVVHVLNVMPSNE